MKIINKKRRRQNKTNYTKRFRLLQGRKPRLIIRKSNKYITIELIESKIAQDFVKINVNSRELIKYGWPNEREGSLKSLGAAYLAGLLFGKKAKGHDNLVLDTGLIKSTKGSRIYAALNGIVDSGLKIPSNKEMFPEEARIKKDFSFFDKVKENIMKIK